MHDNTRVQSQENCTGKLNKTTRVETGGTKEDDKYLNVAYFIF